MISASPIETPPFPFEPAAEQRARAAVIDAVRQYEQTQLRLQGAIAECVRHLRARGMPPEAMLITMKAFIRHAAITQSGNPNLPGSVAKPLMEDIVEWCIGEYFRGS